MVTAADGASAFYTLENNQARTETPEEAIDLDRRTQKCWLGHAHMWVHPTTNACCNAFIFKNFLELTHDPVYTNFERYVLDNSTDFESKLQRLVNIVSRHVGLPTNLSRRSAKYLLRQRPNTTLFPKDVDFHRFEVEKVSNWLNFTPKHLVYNMNNWQQGFDSLSGISRCSRWRW